MTAGGTCSNRKVSGVTRTKARRSVGTAQEQPEWHGRARQSDDGAPKGGRCVGDRLHDIWEWRGLVEAHFKPDKTDLPKLVRLGMQMTLPAGFERITWLGPGPQETYWRSQGREVWPLYRDGADQFYADYTEIGETGNKADALGRLTNGKIGLMAIEGPQFLSANALHYGAEDLNAAKHAFELPRRDFVTFNLDLKQQGVGGDNSWGAWPHKEFLIPCQEYRIAFACDRLRPGKTLLSWPGKRSARAAVSEGG